MTREEKAKAYDEALERAKAYHRNELSGTRKEITEYIFPEFRESEDERTREFLINFIKLENGTNLSPDDAERCIAYLEKQNEKLNYLTTSRVTILPDGGTVRHTIGYLEKGKKQKPVLAYDENGDAILSDFEAALFSAFSDAWQTYLHGEDVNVVEWAKEHAPELLRVAGKPAEWSEEDEDYYDTIVRKLEVIGDDCGLSSNQIKFLRNHCPSHRSEWNEEDEKMIKRINSILDFHPSYEKEKNWFNSFCQQTPCPHYTGSSCTYIGWKPSEEQMNELWSAISYIELPGSNYLGVPELLKSLYEQLQKL